MPMTIVIQPGGVLIHYVHADGSVHRGSSPRITRLNGVVTIKLFTRTRVGVHIAVVNVGPIVQRVMP